jgi:hypothetical protein
LYARKIATARRTLGPGVGSASAENTVEGAAVLGFKSGDVGGKQLTLRYDDDVEAWCSVVVSKNLSNQTLRTIPDNSPADSLRRGNAKPADRTIVAKHEHRQVAAVDPRAAAVCLLKFLPPTNSLLGAKAGHDITPSERRRRAHPGQPVWTLLPADAQALAPLRAAALEHEPTVLCAHTDEKPVSPATMPRVWLERPLTLHATPSLSACERRTTNVNERIGRVSTPVGLC